MDRELLLSGIFGKVSIYALFFQNQKYVNIMSPKPENIFLRIKKQKFSVGRKTAMEEGVGRCEL